MNRNIVVVLAGLAVGCAHQRAAAPVVEAPTPIVVAPKPAPVDQGVEELESALAETQLRFAFDRDLLDDASMAALQKLVPVLLRHPAVRVTISGNSDERGTEEYNLLLGHRRAEAARKYLIALGVEAERLETITFGAERPLSEEHDEAAWALNRRDEFSVTQRLSMADQLVDTLR